MPIFEFECEACRNKFEMLVLRSDELVKCPDCGSERARRVMSVCGFKSGGDKGAASSRVGSTTASSACAGCTSGNCSSCH